MLCQNRIEGFGPSSSISSPFPTSCFVDIILLPLPVWIALVLLPIIYLLTRTYDKIHFNPSTIHLRHPQSTLTQKPKCLTATSVIYYLLVIVNILMQTLEIVRLKLLGVGIGLQPFVYVGLLLGGVLRWTKGFESRVRGWEGINAVVWVGGIVMSVIQAIGLSKEGMDKGKGGKYPISDQVIDVAVMAGVYAMIAGLEVVLALWRRRRERAISKKEEVADRSEFVELDYGKRVSP